MEHDTKVTEAHARLMQTLADRYNTATPKDRRAMDANLTKTKAKAVSSVRGIKSIFPALRKTLSVVD